jgi:hypothetical protein
VRTLLLDRSKWDILIDASGNIAVADDPYAPAQDASSAIKLFKGELYYNTTAGVPYWDRAADPQNRGNVLGFAPPLNFMRQLFVAAALTVPVVASAKCFLSAITRRGISGQVQITTDDGQQAAANF